jgi:FAD dependent oxidoreductase TIGR03364
MASGQREARGELRSDVVVVGSGVVGLAQALAAARRGRSVTVIERGGRAELASVRNFGMCWPIGVAAGPLREAALVSRRLWIELAAEAGFWLDQCGSVHLARAPDEQAVLEEYVGMATGRDTGCRMITADEAVVRCPGARRAGLRCAMWSPLEVGVDPREAIVAVTAHLRDRYGVRFEFNATVAEVDAPWVRTSDGRRFRFDDEAVVCGGVETWMLYPDVLNAAGVYRCKLQMMRTVVQPDGWRLQTHVAGGPTLRHYKAFAACPSVEGLRQRIAAEFPLLEKFMVHVMAAQNGLGEITIGDSHEYDDAITPFDNPEIDAVILEHLNRMLDLPDGRIGQRWHGVYTKHATQAQLVHEPQPGVRIVINTNGLGMTLSFGLAEQAMAARERGAGVDGVATAMTV